MGSLQVNIEQHNDDYLLIDGDAVGCIGGFSVKEGEPVSHAYHAVNMILQHCRDAAKCSNEIIYLTSSDKSNFRFERATIPRIINKGKPTEYELKGYKANRKEAKKPFYYSEIRQYLTEHERAITVSGAEADDALATMATYVKTRAVIATHDKDLNMVPVDIYDMINRQLKPYNFDKHGIIGYTILTGKNKLYGRGRAWFFAQMLLGDSGDNIPGIPGYGNVKVYKTLQHCTTEQEYFNVVWSVYVEHALRDTPPYKGSNADALFDAKQRFLEVAALLWMRQTDMKDIEKYLEANYEFI